MARRASVAVAAVAVSVSVLSGCGSGSDAAEDNPDAPYRVLMTGALSGPGALAANAKTSVLAAQAGAQVQNGAGGIAGRDIELTVVDDGGDPTVAVTKLREALASDTPPDFYVTSGPSSVSSAVLPILKQNEVLSFNIAPTEESSNPATFPLNFDLALSAQGYADSVAAHMVDEGYDDIGIIHGSSAYGEAFGKGMADAVTASGLRLAGSQEYDIAALDMTAQLQALKNAGARALAVDAYGAPLGYLLQSLQRLDWDVPLVGNTSVAGTALVATPPPDGVLGTPAVENLVVQVFDSTLATSENENVKTMVDTMASLGTIESILIVAGPYDAFSLVAAAAEKAGSTDAAELAAALETEEVSANGATAFLPRYNFTEQSHSPDPGDGAVRFVPPSPMVNGQYSAPAAP
ncbi:ABC transporter substrate-binding protein [Rhodococcus aetherivorans]|uniref:ABC transporter substrate-binding protein n=1 Tax=Rhodococcus aetherivorans TaxID=191292 RepID=UPI00045C8D3E|nr:ABC transporter substrate-binding protein [Rhodococcus aetherivorans]KDE12257.1 branched-chain amino acid ABC transporter substrate-binding protein [Rhodococcus aetherivorans]